MQNTGTECKTTTDSSGSASGGSPTISCSLATRTSSGPAATNMSNSSSPVTLSGSVIGGIVGGTLGGLIILGAFLAWWIRHQVAASALAFRAGEVENVLRTSPLSRQEQPG